MIGSRTFPRQLNSEVRPAGVRTETGPPPQGDLNATPRLVYRVSGMPGRPTPDSGTLFVLCRTRTPVKNCREPAMLRRMEPSDTPLTRGYTAALRLMVTSKLDPADNKNMPAVDWSAGNITQASRMCISCSAGERETADCFSAYSLPMVVTVHLA